MKIAFYVIIRQMENKIIIFSDGSSRGNPGPGGWGAIVMQKLNITPSSIVKSATVQEYQKEEIHVTELGGGENHTTNNRMELTGAIKALSSLGSLASKSEEIILNTDSSYVINGITKWIYGWQKNGWKNSGKEDVVNRDLWQELIKVSSGKKIKWNHIDGHSGIPGNERCDEIATSFADNEKIELFKGNISEYSIDLNILKTDKIKKKIKSNKGQAYSYVSFVNGVLNIDKTWAECEKRVKGVKGNVKYKKACSEEKEKEILKEFKK